MSQLVAPTSTSDRASDPRSRRITYSWLTGREVGEGIDRGAERVDLTIRYDLDRRMFVARLYVVTVIDGEGYSVVSHSVQIGGPRGGQRPTSALLDYQEVSRYSASKLAGYGADVLARLIAGSQDFRTSRIGMSDAAEDIISRIPAAPMFEVVAEGTVSV